MTSQEGAVTRTKSFGVVAGLATTVRNLFRRAHTQSYPNVKPDLPPRTRGVIALLEENCTACMLCARECPDWCIYIDAHKEAVEVPGSDKPRQRNVLSEFSIDFSLCMYCGICIEVCPFDALFWTPEFEYTEYDIGDLLHDKDRLREWMPTVPAPVTEDVLGEPAPEVVAASAPPKPVRTRPAAKAAPAKAASPRVAPAATAKPEPVESTSAPVEGAPAETTAPAKAEPAGDTTPGAPSEEAP